jgi:PIN domain nuclease of toxin-antitoxin system
VRSLLLDTHVVLWAFGEPQRVRAEVRKLLVDPRVTVYVSSASVWEVEIKRAIGKLVAPQGFGAECVARGFDPLHIAFEHAELAGSLPGHHADPFDRMLIAQASVEGLQLVTADAIFGQYDVDVLDAV